MFSEELKRNRDDDSITMDMNEEEAANLEASRLQMAIAEAKSVREELQQRNLKLQRRVAALLQKNQESGVPMSSSEVTDGRSPEKRGDRPSNDESNNRYLECLRNVHEVKVQVKTVQSQYDKVALELQARLDEKEAKMTEIQDAFIAFKREIASNAESLRNGKPIAKRVIAQFEAAELRKDQEVEKVRLKHINLRTHSKKLEQQLHAKEQLAEGLHLIDFEQLKIENQTLNEKIEERNEELHKLRMKTMSTVQVLTHIKEKLQFVLAENQTLKQESQQLVGMLNAHRDQLTQKKKECEANRLLANRLKSQEGFVQSELLVEDFAKHETEIVELEHRRAQLVQKHALLLK